MAGRYQAGRRQGIAMDEEQQVIATINRVLDRVSTDPDDDAAMLARQFHRTLEAIGHWQEECPCSCKACLALSNK